MIRELLAELQYEKNSNISLWEWLKAYWYPRKYSRIPGFTGGTEFLIKGIWKNKKLYWNDITVESGKRLNPFSWRRPKGACKSQNKMITDKQIEKCKSYYPDAYVIHYHTATWDKGRDIWK